MKLHKKFFSILLAIIAALSLALCSCGDPAPKGKLYTLEQAYNAGLITIDDFLDIAYFENLSSESPVSISILHNNKTQSFPINYTSSKELTELSDEKRKEIATVTFDSEPGAFATFIEYGETRESIINDIIIVKYLGEHSGCHAVMLTTELWEHITMENWTYYEIQLMPITVADKIQVSLYFSGHIGIYIYSYK